MDILSGPQLLAERDRAYVGWRPAGVVERVNAWRNESPGNVHLHFRLREFEEFPHGALVARAPMPDEEYAAAVRELGYRLFVEAEEAATRYVVEEAVLNAAINSR
jgi:hypothetical protein